MIANTCFHDFTEEIVTVGSDGNGTYWLEINMRGGIGGMAQAAFQGMVPERMIRLADKIRDAAMPYVEATTP